MINGISPGTEAWRELKAWANERMSSAQSAINNKVTSDDETRYQRGRRDLAEELLAALEPQAAAQGEPKRTRERSNY